MRPLAEGEGHRHFQFVKSFAVFAALSVDTRPN